MNLKVNKLSCSNMEQYLMARCFKHKNLQRLVTNSKCCSSCQLADNPQCYPYMVSLDCVYIMPSESAIMMISESTSLTAMEQETRARIANTHTHRHGQLYNRDSCS